VTKPAASDRSRESYLNDFNATPHHTKTAARRGSREKREHLMRETFQHGEHRLIPSNKPGHGVSAIEKASGL